MMHTPMTAPETDLDVSFARRRERDRRPVFPVCRTLVLASAGLCAVTAGEAMARGGGHGSPDAFRGLYEKSGTAPKVIKPSSTGKTPVERGRFGRLFPLGSKFKDTNGKTRRLKAHPSDLKALRKLGASNGPMHSKSDADTRDSNIPAGYTFFGQFVDHDVTFDTVSSLDKPILDIDSENARSATLDLDSVYGGGPDRSPFLYDLPYLVTGAEIANGRHDLLRRTSIAGTNADNRASAKPKPVASTPTAPAAPKVKPKLEPATSGSDEASAINDILGNLGEDDAQPAKPAPTPPKKKVEPAKPTPAPGRYARGGVKRDVALIGDPRNDENVVISQMQAAFIAYHNRLVDLLLKKDGVDLVAMKASVADAPTVLARRVAEEALFKVSSDVFERARNHAIHYYHRVLIDDFLPRVVGLDRIQAIRSDGRKFYFPKGFQDRKTGRIKAPYIPVEFSVAAYRYGHAQVRNSYTLSKATSGVPLFGRGAGPAGIDMMGFKPMSKALLIDWRYFFPFDGARNLVQAGRPINTSLPDALFKLIEGGIVPPGDVASLASRNLNRGRSYFLPSGQAIARMMKFPAQQVVGADWATQTILRVQETPLWYYILQEAKQQGVSQISSKPFSLPRATQIAPSVKVYGAATATDTQQTAAVRKHAGSAGGDILGPVGGTIVGEVLLGLIEHYRQATGRGIDFTSEIDDHLSHGKSGGNRDVYQMRHLLTDAGVAPEAS